MPTHRRTDLTREPNDDPKSAIVDPLTRTFGLPAFGLRSFFYCITLPILPGLHRNGPSDEK